MLPAVVSSDLRRIYGVFLRQSTQLDTPEDRLTDADIKRWAFLTGVPESTLCDQIAIYLALGFQNSELTFQFCDAVVNDIFGVVISAHVEIQDIFYQIYCAFDGGEYEHKYRRGEDPVEAYTRPYIVHILAGLSAGSS
jgi:hypothetical protein